MSSATAGVPKKVSTGSSAALGGSSMRAERRSEDQHQRYGDDRQRSGRPTAGCVRRRFDRCPAVPDSPPPSVCPKPPHRARRPGRSSPSTGRAPVRRPVLLRNLDEDPLADAGAPHHAGGDETGEPADQAHHDQLAEVDPQQPGRARPARGAAAGRRASSTGRPASAARTAPATSGRACAVDVDQRCQHEDADVEEHRDTDDQAEQTHRDRCPLSPNSRSSLVVNTSAPPDRSRIAPSTVPEADDQRDVPEDAAEAGLQQGFVALDGGADQLGLTGSPAASARARPMRAER